MTLKCKKVNRIFPQLNCAQTVFSLFAPELGIDEKTALKIASGFGGGMACAETCGAVTGSYMVIGMKHGHSDPEPEKRANTKQLIKKFNDAFVNEHGTLLCKKLLGCDISTADGLTTARNNNLFETKCPKFLETACSILGKDF